MVSRERGPSRILMRGPGRTPGSLCRAMLSLAGFFFSSSGWERGGESAGSDQIPPGISLLTDSVWSEIRVEFGQVRFWPACRPGVRSFSVTQAPPPLADPGLTRYIRSLLWIAKPCKCIMNSGLLMMAELYTNSSGTFLELARNWPGTGSKVV